MDIKRRIENLEKKAGVDKEATFVLIKNAIRVNTACEGLEDTERCPPFNKFKQGPRGINEFGFAVFQFPCKGCKGAQA